MKEKIYSKLNMMFIGFHFFEDSLKQDSQPGILAEQWYFSSPTFQWSKGSSSQHSRSFCVLTTNSERLLNKGLGKVLSLRQPGRGPKLMLLTSKQRPIYNSQRRWRSHVKFLQLHYIPNGTNIQSTILILSAIIMKTKQNKKSQNFEIYFVKKNVALTSALQINVRCLLTYKISPIKASLSEENPPHFALLGICH